MKLQILSAVLMLTITMFSFQSQAEWGQCTASELQRGCSQMNFRTDPPTYACDCSNPTPNYNRCFERVYPRCLSYGNSDISCMNFATDVCLKFHGGQ